METTHHILLVKDDPDQVTLFTLILTRVGYQVTVVPHAEAALALPIPPSFNLLLTDWHLLQMPGDLLISVWHYNFPSTRTILMSSDSDVRYAALACGADGWFRKPIDLTQLYQIIETTLQANTPMLVH